MSIVDEIGDLLARKLEIERRRLAALSLPHGERAKERVVLAEENQKVWLGWQALRTIWVKTVFEIGNSLSPLSDVEINDWLNSRWDTTIDAGAAEEQYAKWAGRYRELIEGLIRVRAIVGGKAEATTRTKRSTLKGEARAKIVSALTAHHDREGLLIQTPLALSELARQAGVSKGSVARFLDAEFGGEEKKGGYAKYRVICRFPRRLRDSLHVLNGEFSPDRLYGATPPSERERAD
jgi:hypothetical protein